MAYTDIQQEDIVPQSKALRRLYSYSILHPMVLQVCWAQKKQLLRFLKPPF
jgi:hypothetical protein